MQVEGSESWHFHLCIGPHQGSAALPTPPALAEWRRCARAAFFQNRDRAGRPSAWGLRLWNGRDEQMLTVFLPNPWIDPARGRYVDTPDWSRLDLWMDLRARHAGRARRAPARPRRAPSHPLTGSGLTFRHLAAEVAPPPSPECWIVRPDPSR